MIEEFGMTSLKKKRFSIKRDPHQVLITKPVNASQTDGPVSETSAGRVQNGGEERYFIVSCVLL